MIFTKHLLWVAFRNSWLGSLYFVKTNAKMNAEMYIEVLEKTSNDWLFNFFYRDVQIIMANPVFGILLGRGTWQEKKQIKGQPDLKINVKLWLN